MYVDTMQQIYGNVTKVMVDSKQGNNLLYLPLDKIMQMSAATGTAAPALTTPNTPSTGASPASAAANGRTRDAERSRSRDVR
jgi:membrane protease subunit HflK